MKNTSPKFEEFVVAFGARRRLLVFSAIYKAPKWLPGQTFPPWWCLEMDGRCWGSFEKHLVKPRRDSLLPSHLPLRGYVSMCSRWSVGTDPWTQSQTALSTFRMSS